jgi:hypothetical protein
MHEAHTGRGLIDVLPAWARGTHEGLLQILFMDVETLQAYLKRTLFFWTDAELTHVYIHRWHSNDMMSYQCTPLWYLPA